MFFLKKYIKNSYSFKLSGLSIYLGRILFMIGLYLLLFMGSSFIKADDSGTVDFIFDKYSYSVTVPDTFDVTISVRSENSTQTISAFGFAIVYDSSKLEYQSRSTLENALTWSDVSEISQGGALRRILFTGNADASGYSLGTSAVPLVKLTFKAIASENTTTSIYLVYSNDRNNYDNYTAAVLLGGTTDVSDHTYSDANNPLVVNISVPSNSTGGGDNSSSDTGSSSDSGSASGSDSSSDSGSSSGSSSSGSNSSSNSGSSNSGSSASKTSSNKNSKYPETGIGDYKVGIVGAILLVFGVVGFLRYKGNSFIVLDKTYKHLYGKKTRTHG